jgi:hypothetical protein
MPNPQQHNNCGTSDRCGYRETRDDDISIPKWIQLVYIKCIKNQKEEEVIERGMLYSIFRALALHVMWRKRGDDSATL